MGNPVDVHCGEMSRRYTFHKWDGCGGRQTRTASVANQIFHDMTGVQEVSNHRSGQTWL
jgi:hypothetical protein